MSNNDYSQFSNFDPDNLGDGDNTPPPSRDNGNGSGDGHRNGNTLSDAQENQENDITSIWSRDKIAQLFREEDTQERPVKNVVVTPDSNSLTSTHVPAPANGSDSGDNGDNIISREDLFADEQEDPNLSKTERSFSNSPWSKGGLVGIGALVTFVAAGIFLNNVFNRNKVAKIPSTPTPTPTVTSSPAPVEDETGKLKTEIAIGTQAEQLAALNRAKSPNNPTPTPTPEVSPSLGAARTTGTNQSPAQTQRPLPAPARSNYPVYRAPVDTARVQPQPPRAIASEVRRVPVPVQTPVRQVPVASKPAPVRQVPVAVQPAPARTPVRQVPVAVQPAPAPTPVRQIPVAVQPAPARTPVRQVPVAVQPAPAPTPARPAQQLGSAAPEAPLSPPPDPYAQWQRLASLGSYGQALVPPDETLTAAVPSQQQLAMPVPTYAPGAMTPNVNGAIAPSAYVLPRAVPVIAAMAPDSANAVATESTEESVLLSGQPVQSQSEDFARRREATEEDVLLGRSPQMAPNSALANNNGAPPASTAIQVGSTAEGKLVTPVLNPSNATSYANRDRSSTSIQRFAVSLTTPIPNAYGQPIINPGTLVVFTVGSVASNGFVDAVAESIVLPDGSEFRLPPGAIGIRGKNGNPLIAEKWDDKGSEIFSLDANAFLFGAISNVGRVLNQPQSESYEYSSAFGFGSGRNRIERGNPNIAGAVLEGGFAPVLASIMQRNAIAMQELRERANIWYVAPGNDIQIFVNQSFQL